MLFAIILAAMADLYPSKCSTSWELNLVWIPVMVRSHLDVWVYVQAPLSGIPSVQKHDSPL